LNSLISGISVLFGWRKDPSTPGARQSVAPSSATEISSTTVISSQDGELVTQDVVAAAAQPDERLTEATVSLPSDDQPAEDAGQPDRVAATDVAEMNELAETASASDWQARLDVARQTRRESGPAAALPLFEGLRRDAPDLAAGWLEGAACLRDLQRFDEAEALLAGRLAASPSDASALHDAARLFERRGAWSEAEALWRRFLVLPNPPWWVHSALATTLQRQGRLPEADMVLSEAVPQYPAEAAVACDYAKLAQASGNWAEAKARWENASARFPNHPTPLLGLAAALKQEGDLPGAERTLRAAVQANPDDLWAQHDLARFLEHRGDWAGAEQIWLRLTNASGAPWWVHSALATTLQRQGRLPEADEVLS
jgi:tetratricopeptide (TPR) repeat protein